MNLYLNIDIIIRHNSLNNKVYRPKYNDGRINGSINISYLDLFDVGYAADI